MLFRLALLVIVDQIKAEAAPVAVFEEKPLGAPLRRIVEVIDLGAMSRGLPRERAQRRIRQMFDGQTLLLPTIILECI